MPDITCPNWCTAQDQHPVTLREDNEAFHAVTVSAPTAEVRVVIDQWAIADGAPVDEPALIGLVGSVGALTPEASITLAADVIRALAIISIPNNEGDKG
jgi:hypothetical protein